MASCDADAFGGGAYHSTLTGCTVYGNSATAGAGNIASNPLFADPAIEYRGAWYRLTRAWTVEEVP